jgi:phage terminase large subunit-like protein
LRHGGNPVLRWMVGNVATTQDPAGNIKPDRQKSTEKIDGIVATVMAIGRAMAHADTGVSRYEEEDLLFLDDDAV